MHRTDIAFTVSNLHALLARMPHRARIHTGIGVCLTPGAIYAADKARVLRMPSNYRGAATWIEWHDAYQHLEVNNVLQLDGRTTRLNGEDVRARTSGKRIHRLRRWQDATAEHTTQLTFTQGNLLRALRGMNTCTTIAIIAHRTTATLIGEEHTEREDAPKTLHILEMPCETAGKPPLLYLNTQHLLDAATLPASHMRIELQETFRWGECARRRTKVTAGEYIEYISPVVTDGEKIERDLHIELLRSVRKGDVVVEAVV